MKTNVLVAIAICTSLLAKAGDFDVTYHGGGHGMGSTSSKFTLGISLGAALPMGDYGKTNRDSALNSTTYQYYGYAKMGIHFDVSASYLFAGPFGGMVILGGNLNPLNTAVLQAREFPYGGGTVSAKDYYIGQYMLGPCLSLPIGSILNINIHATAGLLTANYPTITSSLNGGGSVTSTGQGTSGFGYNAGIGIRLNFTPQIGLLIDGSYIGGISDLVYTSTTSTSTITGFTVVDNYNTHYNMNFSMVTASIGIAFSF